MAATLLVQVQDSGTMTAKFFAASAYDTLVESVSLTRGSTNIGWATGTISTASGLCLCRVVDGSNNTKGWWSGVIPSSGTVIIGDMSGVDWQQVANATSTVNLSGTTLKSFVRKNQALNTFPFLMTDDTNHQPATGKTVTVTRSIDGGAFGAGTLSAVTELSNGIYLVSFAAADLNGTNIMLKATATGCDPTYERIITQP